MRAKAIVLFLVMLIGLSGLAYTCIEPLSLKQMVVRTDCAILGTVVDVRCVEVDTGESKPYIATLVTVDGENLYTGEALTMEAGFLGGSYGGRTILVTSMPAIGDYRIGNEVLMFTSPTDRVGPNMHHWVMASMGGLFRVHRSVVFGKGRGFAIDRNIHMAELRSQIDRAVREKGRSK